MARVEILLAFPERRLGPQAPLLHGIVRRDQPSLRDPEPSDVLHGEQDDLSMVVGQFELPGADRHDLGLGAADRELDFEVPGP